jgi:hypothetical protein
MDDIYVKMVVEIVKGQEAIIGPIAIERANSVSGLVLDWNSKSVSFEGDKASIIDSLVDQYRQLFGSISVEVCKEAAHHVSGLTLDQLPGSLQ